MFKRRKSKKTDYRQRIALLKSGLPRIVVRRSIMHIHVQVTSFDIKGDKIIVEEFSKNLKKYGWLGHTGNIPAAYLTGLLIGLKAKRNGINSAVLDIGLQTSIKGSALYGVISGIDDAGIKVPFGKDILPNSDRIRGKHISEYAAKVRKDDNQKYKKMFASYLKSGIEPEKITENFDQTKNNIINEFGIELKKVNAAVVNDSTGEE